MMTPTSKSIQRVGRFLKKTLGSIKSTICSSDYKNLPNDTPLLSPYSCSRRCPEDSQTQTKESYTVICCDTAVADTTHQKSLNNQHKKKPKKVAEPFEDAKKRGDALAQKMKDLNMVDLRDVDHALDVREALRCYSSIRSPVYLDIVDNFFTDMYYEFSDPRTSAKINGSRRKAGSFRL